MSANVFSNTYLLHTAILGLQREFFVIVLLSLMLATLFTKNGDAAWKILLIGFLCGFCVTIKPQTVFVWLLALSYSLTNREARRPLSLRDPLVLKTAGCSLAGFLLPILVALAYLISTRSLSGLIDIATNYWPLYGHLDGRHQTIAGAARFFYIFRSSMSACGYSGFALALPVGLFCLKQAPPLSDPQRRQSKMLLILMIFFAVYPATSGQFWYYHILPLFYFSALFFSLIFRNIDTGDVRRQRLFAMAQLGVALALASRIGWGLRHYKPERDPEDGRADKMAVFLRTHLRPGDRAHPLDWTGGALHAMLLSRARVATRFIYDFHFYHHVSTPYAQSLRQEFLREFTAQRPRFVIQVFGEKKPWPSGKDTTRKFPELEAILSRDYAPAIRGDDWVILERLPSQPLSRNAG